jgi:outer membrane lipoprotein
LIALTVTGCAAGVPPAIRQAPTAHLTVSETQGNPTESIGARVRWGGTILAVRNRERVTEIEVLARPLDGFGKPDADAPGQGRLIALLAGFVDPAEYPKARSLTVAGRLERVETRPVGEYPYPYPIVAAEALYLWPEPPPPEYPYPYPYPWYDPWFSLSPWPGPWSHPWHRPMPLYRR